MRVVGSTVVSKTAGIGNIEFKGKVGAVLQRDEGIVALLDMSNPKMPKTVGRYEDGATDSFDGDLAFSKDGKFLFYARQTHQFSKDGVHVLDVSDPAAPALAYYQASGGTLEVATYHDGAAEWVVFLDAVDGLHVRRCVDHDHVFDGRRGIVFRRSRAMHRDARRAGGADDDWSARFIGHLVLKAVSCCRQAS